MNALSVGILGMGYLGQFLWPLLSDFPESWGTHFQSTPAQQDHFQHFLFQWDDEQTWRHLPKRPSTLVLTIPPILKTPEAEEQRLHIWGQWMNRFRPKLEKMVYISSTGVYPKQNGLWKEHDVFEPDQLSGQLRLMTERVLQTYFDLKVVRPGGIYGPDRHLVQRVQLNKPINLSLKPIHRIHVQDLAQIVLRLINSKTSIACLNAVDQEARPSIDILKWLTSQKGVSLPEFLINQINQNPEMERQPSITQRFISNERLLQELAYAFQFPTFREGYRAILNTDSNSMVLHN